MNMIIGKRQIILSALVLGLGIAVYLNWQYSSIGQELPVTNILDEDTVNYGEAQYVDNPRFDTEFEEADEESFFVEAKLSRQRARDEAVETLAVMLQDASLSGDQKADFAIRATELANSIEVEGKIENLIKAKGFADVMVYYDTERADIMVKTPGLVSEDVTQLRDIVLKETEIPVENIAIIEIG